MMVRAVCVHVPVSIQVVGSMVLRGGGHVCCWMFFGGFYVDCSRVRGMMCFLLVSQHRDLFYECSSTAETSCPLSAGCRSQSKMGARAAVVVFQTAHSICSGGSYTVSEAVR